MKKSEIMNGLNQDSTFNKMKSALGANKQRQEMAYQKKEANFIESNNEMTSKNGLKNSQIKPLTDEEKNIVLPLLVRYLQKKTNDMIHITADQIIREFNDNKEKIGMKNNFNNPRLMKLTAYIRYMRIVPLISGSTGYYISDDPYIIMGCVESLRQRAEAIMAAADGMLDMANNIKLLQNDNDPFGFDFDID
jgi:hypothetical protein